MFEFSYKKNNNNSLFRDFKKSDLTNVKAPQNYVPLYNSFFSLTNKNWNSINLNNPKYIQTIYSKINENVFTIQLNNKKSVHSFFKFSPLIDPVKYMCGKYDEFNDEQIFSIPSFDNVENNQTEHIHERMLRKNNVSYVDSFFSYLSCKLKQEHGIVNCQDFYGSFLGIKNDFKIDIFYDIDYLTDSPFFYEKTGKLFDVEETIKDYLSVSSRKNRSPIGIENVEITDLQFDTLDASINDIFQNKEIPENFVELSEIDIGDTSLICEFDLPTKNTSNNQNSQDEEMKLTAHSDDNTNSLCSSRSSKTSIDEESGDDSNDAESEDGKKTNNISETSKSTDTSGTYSTLEEEQIIATIYKMPVQIICLEKMRETLDSYMENNDVDDNEWSSIFLQIIFLLLVYQKAFDFTHNDLHTNNIMYIDTEEEYLYYKYNKEYYRVPTFGKIWKIIDFGRAIYTFKGKQIVSDSYDLNEDAGTQFNFGPYYDSNKPLIKPNNAFDLCRLACSLFDYFFDDINDTKDCDDSLSKLVNEWCCDDKGRNILYKDNNKERYPGFKLYKMITRTVTKHTPERQLQNKFFSKMKIQRRHLNKSSVLIDIDRTPSYI
jgi:hypothetical protein